MKRLPLFEVMDKLSEVANAVPVEKAPEEVLRHASLAGNVLGMEALSHLFVLESTRRKHAEAKYEHVRKQLEMLEADNK